MSFESSEYEPRSSNSGMFRLAKRAIYQYIKHQYKEMPDHIEQMVHVNMDPIVEDAAERLSIGILLEEKILQYKFFIRVCVGCYTQIEREKYGPRIVQIKETVILSQPIVIDAIKNLREDYRREIADKVREMGQDQSINAYEEARRYAEIPTLTEDLSLLGQMITDGTLETLRVHVPEKISYPSEQ